MNRIRNLELGDDLAWISDPFDIFYLTNQKVSKGLLLVNKNHSRFFVDKRYLEGCQKSAKVDVIEEKKENIEQFLKDLDFDKILFDSKKTTYFEYETILSFAGKKKVEAQSVVSPLRMVKESGEIVKMQKSAALNQEGLLHAISLLKVGVTEKEVAWEFEKYCREKGAEGMAFSPTVAFGAGTSIPHYKTGDVPLKKGDPVLIDVGIILDGYASDLTRSHLFKGENERYDFLKALVIEAYNVALSLCLPGNSLYETDLAVRQFFQDNGVDTLFKHSLGHSLGLEVHEYPIISPRCDPKLVFEEGMVVAIEPGLYEEGKFGVRYENTIVVTRSGSKNFYEELEA